MSGRGLGRTEAIDQLGARLDQAGQGSGRMVTIAGPFPASCQLVVDELVELSRHRGVRLLTAQGSLTERYLMGGILDQLLKCVNPRRDVFLELDELGLATPDDWPVDSPLNASSARVAHAFANEIVASAGQSTLLLVVEDAQYTDLASQHALAVLGRRISRTPILSVIFLSSGVESTATAWFSMADHHVMPLLLAPPTAADLEERFRVMQPQLSVNYSEVYTLTGGDLGLVNALLEDACVARECKEFIPGPCYTHAVMAKLRTMGAGVVALARCLAVAGEDSSAGILAKVTGMSAREVQHGTRLLEQAGMVVHGSFCHWAIPQALIDTMGSSERAELRLTLARTLFDKGVDSVRIAKHLIADRQELESWSLPCLVTAARRAIISGDLSLAAACAERITRSDQNVAGELIQLIISGRTTPTTIVPQLEILIQALNDQLLSSQDAALVVKMCLWAGRRQEASEARAKMAELELLSDVRLQVDLWAAYALYCGFDNEIDCQDWLPSMPVNDPWCTWVHDLTRGRTGISRSVERLLASSVLDDSSLEVIVMMIINLIAEGQYDSAHRWATRFSADARGLGCIRWEAIFLAFQAACLLHQGFVADAAKLAAKAMDSISSENWGCLIFAPLATLVNANARLARHAESDRLLKYHDGQELRGLQLASLTLAVGRHSSAVGRRLAAITDYSRCRDILAACTQPLALENLVPWRLDLAEAYIELGRSTIAVQLVREHLARVKGREAPTRGRATLLLALCQPMAERRLALEKAVAQLDSSGDHLVLVEALKALAACCQKMGNLDRARLLLRRASRERCYCQLDSEEASHPSVVVPASERPLPERAVQCQKTSSPSLEAKCLRQLTEAQLRVAELAALGHTNEEISKRLFITVSTVEQHLTRVFRKLDIKGRNELSIRVAM